MSIQETQEMTNLVIKHSRVGNANYFIYITYFLVL